MSDFKEWAMARKAQSLTGKERIAETYQETNARTQFSILNFLGIWKIRHPMQRIWTA